MEIQVSSMWERTLADQGNCIQERGIAAYAPLDTQECYMSTGISSFQPGVPDTILNAPTRPNDNSGPADFDNNIGRRYQHLSQDKACTQPSACRDMETWARSTYFVNEAITKLASMQLSDGSFAYWPGAAESNPWSTVYATHFLVEAKRAGYAVSDNVLNQALTAVSAIARSKKTTDYRFQRDNRVMVQRIADKSTIYGLYVLAMAGKPHGTREKSDVGS